MAFTHVKAGKNRKSTLITLCCGYFSMNGISGSGESCIFRQIRILLKGIIFRYIAQCGVFLIMFTLYNCTLSPSFLQIDTGELAAVQATFGVAHPTGYPLFTLLGFLWSKLHLAGSLIWWLNLLNALYASAGAVFIYLAARHIWLHYYFATAGKQVSGKKNDRKNTSTATPVKEITALSYTVPAAIALLCASGTTYWLQSAAVEVYALQSLLVSMIMYASARAFLAVGTHRWWWWTGLFTGLAFSNHLTTVMLVPGIAMLFFMKEGLKAGALKKAWVPVGMALVTMVVFYLVLMLTAASDPLFNWGNPSNTDALWKHITGKQYNVWMFANEKVRAANMEKFGKIITTDLTYIGLALGMLGAIMAAVQKHKLIWGLIIHFLCCVLLAVRYDIKDLEPYFLPALISFSLMGVFGLKALVSWMRDAFQRFPVLAVLPLAVPVFVASVNYKKADRSDVYVYEDYTRAALASLPENALLLSRQWDVFISPAYFIQQVSDYRKDVMLVDKELLRRSWYYGQMDKMYPGVWKHTETEKALFLEALADFEAGRPYNPEQIQQRFETLITETLVRHQQERKVYLSPELVTGELRKGGDLKLPQNVQLVPQRYFYQLADSGYVALQDTVMPEIRFPAYKDIYTENVKNLLSTMLIERIGYEMQYNRKKEAKVLYTQLQQLVPGTPPLPELD